MKHRAFTLVELIIVLSIVAIITAIAYPVIAGAVGRAKESQCMSNLRQFGVAIEMYRNDYDGTGKWGTPAQMGMPHPLAVLMFEDYVKPGLEKCGGVDPTRGVRGLYAHFWSSYQDQDWASCVAKWREGTVAMFDVNHRNRVGAYGSPIAINYAIGLTVGGNVRVLNKRGSPETQSWWH